MAKRRANGDVCERCRWQMKRAKRSGGKDGKPAEAGTLTPQKKKTEGRPSQSASLTAPPEGGAKGNPSVSRFVLPLPLGEVARRQT